MTRLVLGFVLLFVALILLATAAGMKSGTAPRPGGAMVRLAGFVMLLFGLISLSTSC